MACPAIHRHGSLHTVRAGKGVLHAQSTHQRVLVLGVQYVNRNLLVVFRFFLFFLEGTLYCNGSTILVIGKCGVVGATLHFLRSIAHSNAHTCHLQHIDVCTSVAEGKNLLHADAQFLYQGAHGMALAHLVAYDLQVVGVGVYGIHHTVQVALQMFLHSQQDLFVLVHEDYLRRPGILVVCQVLHGCRYAVHMAQCHIVHLCFVHYAVVRCIGCHNLVPLIVCQGTSAALSLFFQIGDHLRVNGPFKDNLAGTCFQHLGTIVADDEAVVKVQVYGLGKGQYAICGSSCGQGYTHSILLYLLQDLNGAFTHFAIAVQQCAVNVKDKKFYIHSLNVTVFLHPQRYIKKQYLVCYALCI